MAPLTRDEARAMVAEHGGIRQASRAEHLSFGKIWGALRRQPAQPELTPILDVDSPPPPPDLQAEVDKLRSANGRLYSHLMTAKAKVDELVYATIVAARDAAVALGPIGPTPHPDFKAGPGRAEAALWHLTDWQGAKLTTSYNSEVMVYRVNNFLHKAESITEIQRADHPVDECVILFGGDMVEGLFNFPTQPFEIDATIFGQYVRVSRLLVQVVQYALGMYDRVKVVAEWGNHGRIGGKRDNVPRSDNFDRMCYELARQLLAGEDRLVWDDCPEDIQYLEVGAYQALSIHGDEIGRNGFSSPMTLVRAAHQWGSGAYPRPFRDVYVGHYHNHNEWALANGRGALYQTGSTESDNRYARETMAAAAEPTQRLHFIDKGRGRVSAQYKIWVAED